MDSSGSSIINSSEKIEMKAPSDFDFEMKLTKKVFKHEQESRQLFL